MHHRWRRVFWLAALVAGQTCFAAGAMKLIRPKPVADQVDALPRIVAPSTAGRKINQQLARLDKRAKAAVKGCTSTDNAEPSGSFWQRSVEIEMAGPVYLSLLLTDKSYCGGAHPAGASYPLVFDLRTGTQVNWSSILPGAQGMESAEPTLDGTQVQVVTLDKLQTIYKARFRNESGIKASDFESPEGRMLFLLYPSVGHGLIAIPTNLNYLTRVAAQPVELLAGDLRSLGVDRRKIQMILGKVKKTA